LQDTDNVKTDHGLYLYIGAACFWRNGNFNTTDTHQGRPPKAGKENSYHQEIRLWNGSIDHYLWHYTVPGLNYLWKKIIGNAGIKTTAFPGNGKAVVLLMKLHPVISLQAHCQVLPTELSTHQLTGTSDPVIISINNRNNQQEHLPVSDR
jgi:hypothetical protein